ncbi:nitroreductase [archaeon]|jgi:nitroreductase|nr:nitroreductase [archaeon]
MDLDKCIKDRRSIRKYKSKKVEQDKINLLIDAARYAPSAGNVQDWKFIIVKDKSKKELISNISSNQSWMNQAPIFIVVCSEIKDLKRTFGKHTDTYAKQDCSAAVQNILLKATDLKLGSCWIGGFNENDIKTVLKIPEDGSVKVEAIITIGYSDEDGTFDRYPLKSFISYDEWSTT